MSIKWSVRPINDKSFEIFFEVSSDGKLSPLTEKEELVNSITREAGKKLFPELGKGLFPKSLEEVVINLTEVDHIDIHGLVLIVGLHHKLDTNIRIKVLGSKPVQKVLEVCRLHEIPGITLEAV